VIVIQKDYKNIIYYYIIIYYMNKKYTYLILILIVMSRPPSQAVGGLCNWSNLISPVIKR